MRSSDTARLTDPQRVSAAPATDDWPFGQYNTVLLSNGTALGPGLGGNCSSPYICLLLTEFRL